MLVFSPSFDWLTLTSYSRSDFAPALSLLPDCTIAAGIRRYRGLSDYSRSVFFGSGSQGGLDHFLLRVSGSLANSVVPSLPLSVLSCTRCDVQVTLPSAAVGLSSAADWRLLLQGLQYVSDSLGSRSVSLSLIASESHTLYIGSRSSERFARIYEKLADDGSLWIRFEVELKGDYSRSCWMAFCDGSISLGSVLVSFFSRFASCPPVEFLLDYLADSASPSPSRRVGSGGSLDWLRYQVRPGLWRLFHDHEHGALARRIFFDFAAAVDAAFPPED